LDRIILDPLAASASELARGVAVAIAAQQLEGTLCHFDDVLGMRPCSQAVELQRGLDRTCDDGLDQAAQCELLNDGGLGWLVHRLRREGLRGSGEIAEQIEGLT